MADEIKINLNVRASKSSINVVPEPINVSIDQTTAGGGGPGFVSVGTTEETISFGDTSPGIVLMQNLDTTNFIEWGFSAGVYGGKLTAGGEPTLLTLNSGTIYVKADTAACNLKVVGINA